MHRAPPSPPLDLLVVGALTIDRFADGRVEPGGSVLHIAGALVPRGLRVGVATAAGPEPVAAAGLATLRDLDPDVACAPGEDTATFRHDESTAGRRLWLEGLGREVPLAWRDAAAVLVAPVAGEVGVAELRSLPIGPRRGAILQGWLRTREVGAEVMPLPLRALGEPLASALAGFDLVVASREDLRAEAATPAEQLVALRALLGPRPTLVVTDGVSGLWLDVTGERRHLPVPRVIAGVPCVGAGDILAAQLLVDERGGAVSAMEVVAQVLADRHPR